MMHAPSAAPRPATGSASLTQSAGPPPVMQILGIQSSAAITLWRCDRDQCLKSLSADNLRKPQRSGARSFGCSLRFRNGWGGGTWKALIIPLMRSPPKIRNRLSSRLRKYLVLPGSPCLHSEAGSAAEAR